MNNDAVATNAAQLKMNKELRNRYESPLIKWYETNMTKTEKYKFGLMTYDEFVIWQQEAREKQLAEGQDSDNGNTNHTFWEGDDGDRENISNDDYAAFLEANHIDIANKNSLDYL